MRAEGWQNYNSEFSVDYMNLFEFYLAGGPVMHLILLCSVIALYITVERFMALRRAREVPDDFAKQLRDFIRQGDLKSAVLYSARYDIPLARVIKTGLQKIHRGYRRVQQAMEDQGRAEVGVLERYMGILATVAGVAPLLGFLGTVIGIAIAFQEIASQGGQASPLATTTACLPGRKPSPTRSSRR